MLPDTSQYEIINSNLSPPFHGYDGIKPFFSLEQVEGVFALLFLSFLFFTCIYRRGFGFLKDINLIFSFGKNMSRINETTTASEFWYNFFLTFQFVFLTSVILFVYIFGTGNYAVPTNSFITILLFIGIITAFGVLKYLIYRFVGFIFNIQVVIRVWNRIYQSMLGMMGFIAFFPVLILVYSDYFHEAILYFFPALFIISRLIIFYRIWSFFLQSNVNFLFLIAYLCSVEIIPYILLYEGLSYIFEIDIINWIWL